MYIIGNLKNKLFFIKYIGSFREKKKSKEKDF